MRVKRFTVLWSYFTMFAANETTALGRMASWWLVTPAILDGGVLPMDVDTQVGQKSFRCARL